VPATKTRKYTPITGSKAKNNASLRPVSLVMIPFLPQLIENEHSKSLSSESKECLEMADAVNKQKRTDESIPVLYLGALSHDPHYKNRSLEEYFNRAALEGSTITFVSHGNPLVIGTKTGYTTTAKELAEIFDSLVDMILEKEINNSSAVVEEGESKEEGEGEEVEKLPPADTLYLKKNAIKTQFDFQHCNSGLYLENNDESAMTSFVGRFIITMRELGYTGISVIGYRGYIGELGTKGTKLFEREGNSEKVFGTKVGQLIIAQDSTGFSVTHPTQFKNINVDDKEVFRRAVESLIQRDYPLLLEKRGKPLLATSDDDCDDDSIERPQSLSKFMSVVHQQDPRHIYSLLQRNAISSLLRQGMFARAATAATTTSSCCKTEKVSTAATAAAAATTTSSCDKTEKVSTAAAMTIYQ
jgi:hypothetical protein